MNASQIVEFNKLLTKATELAEVWDKDAGRLWNRLAQVAYDAEGEKNPSPTVDKSA